MSLTKGNTMSKFAFPSNPLFLGFEPLERLVERTARASTDGYPPFNIELVEPNRFLVTLAVAGFSLGDIAITLEDQQLVVRGQQSDADASDERVFLHRGIATRQFRRVFALADGVEVAGARLDNGLLEISLERRAPDTIVKTIPITKG